ncbi:MAG TPA: hypothetical protein VFO88_06330 [Gaiellaceae bacterium]|nr:hypothetical protein [Gaiellaceae bacterium]
MRSAALSRGAGGRALRLATAVVAAGLLMGLAVWSQAARATIFDKGFYEFPYTFSYDDCGFPVEVEGVASGHFRLRTGTGEQASTFFLRDTFSYREVHTNLETGLSFVVRGHGVFNEVRATPLGGTLFAFEAVEAGQPFVIEDAEGNVVVRDRGALRHRIVFDTLGDDVPGGIVIEEFESSVHGPHPGFAEDFPFCEIAAELTGA